MNERIRELSRQAVIEQRAALTDLPPLEEHVIESILSLRAAHDKKFAELIVQECASICELNGQSYKYSFTPGKARLAESTSTHCSQLIKKHFGVK